jgi:hypothetical protein
MTAPGVIDHVSCRPFIRGGRGNAEYGPAVFSTVASPSTSVRGARTRPTTLTPWSTTPELTLARSPLPAQSVTNGSPSNPVFRVTWCVTCDLAKWIVEALIACNYRNERIGSRSFIPLHVIFAIDFF